MAIYHLSVKTISRNSGRSSVAASAYRAGEKLTNEYDGVTHDYSRKSGVVYSTVMLPDQAPKEYENRSVLWNSVEKAENRKDARTAREVEIALPVELNRKEQIELVRLYVQKNFINAGMCADIAIHAGKKSKEEDTPDNPHAHILLTTRPIDQDGQWGVKQRKEYILDKDGNKQYDKKKQAYKCKTVKATNWDEIDTMLKWRENWATEINHVLEKKNYPYRVSHESNKKRGMSETPTKHEGAATHAMERRGIRTEKGSINREIKALNEIKNRLYIEIQKTEQHIVNIKKQAVNFDVSAAARHLEAYRTDFKTAMAQAIRSRTGYKENPIYRQEAAQIKDCINMINQQTTTIHLLERQKADLRLFQFKERKNLQQKIADFEISREEQEIKLKALGVPVPSKADEVIKEKMKLAAQEKAKAQVAMENSHSNGKATVAKRAFLELTQTIPVGRRQAVLDEMEVIRQETKHNGGYEAYQAELTAKQELDALLKPQHMQTEAKTHEIGYAHSR